MEEIIQAGFRCTCVPSWVVEELHCPLHIPSPQPSSSPRIIALSIVQSFSRVPSPQASALHLLASHSSLRYFSVPPQLYGVVIDVAGNSSTCEDVSRSLFILPGFLPSLPLRILHVCDACAEWIWMAFFELESRGKGIALLALGFVCLGGRIGVSK